MPGAASAGTIADGVRAVRPVDDLDAHLGEPDVPHVALLYEVDDGPDGVLDGHVGIETRRAIDVDDLHAEALQAVSDEVLHGHRVRICAGPRPVGAAHGTELHRDLHPVATPLDGAAEKHLVVPLAVEITRVEERDAALDGAVNRAHHRARPGLSGAVL